MLSAEKLVIFLEHNFLFFYQINNIKLKLFFSWNYHAIKGLSASCSGCAQGYPREDVENQASGTQVTTWGKYFSKGLFHKVDDASPPGFSCVPSYFTLKSKRRSLETGFSFRGGSPFNLGGMGLPHK